MGRKEDLVWRLFYKNDVKGFRNNKTDYEARCRACIAQCATQIRTTELTLEANGGLPARTEEAIVAELRAAADPTNPTQANEPARIVGKVDEMLKHAAKCTNNTQAVRVWAEIRVTARATHGPTKENVLPLPSSTATFSTPPTHSTVSAAGTPDHPISRMPLQPLNVNGVPIVQSSRTPTPLQSFPSASTVVDSPSTPEPPSKYRKLDDTRIADIETGVVYVACATANPWTAERVELFQRQLCRLLIACNIAWWAVENPYWRFFFNEWIPDAPVPGRSELSGRILDREAEGCVNEMRNVVGGKFATGQCDGWKSIVRTSIVAMMLNVEYTPWLTHTADISRESKTAVNLLEIVLRELQYAMEFLKIIVVAWCTDCGGEAAKMRRLLVPKYSWMVSLDCWAHQINLIVGDMLKAANFVSIMADALALVKWFNSHSLALGMLRAVTLLKLGAELSLILPCITRWTTHYLCVRRLLHMHRAFQQLLIDDKARVLASAGKGQDAERLAAKMIALLKSEAFWENLQSIERHLEPLARAANITQSDCARLDVVLITLANLYFYYSTQSNLNAAAKSAVLASLEKRWKKADQDIFLLALILNPYIRLTCFHANSPFRTPGHVRRIAEAAFERFYGTAPSPSFRAQLIDYVGWKGSWTAAAMDLQTLKQRAKQAKIEVNLISIWREWSPVADGEGDRSNVPSDGSAQLALLATRILSMVPNSASVERIFSLFGIIQSKLRNRMSQEKVRKIVQVKADTIRRFGTANAGSRKRRFGEEEEDVLGAVPASDAEQSGDINTSTTNNTPRTSGGEPAAGNAEAEARVHGAEFTALAREMMDEAEEEDNAPAPTPTGTIDPEARLLEKLFDYPQPGNTTSKVYKVLTHYWAVGARNLATEEQYQEEEYRSTRPAASA